MWYLTFHYAHKDCLFTDACKSTNTTVITQPLQKDFDKMIEVTAMHKVQGANSEEMINYLASLSERFERIDKNTIFTFMKIIPKKHYRLLYSKEILFVNPVTNKGEYEKFVVSSWKKETLLYLLKELERSKETILLKKISLTNKTTDTIVPFHTVKITNKQKEYFTLAKAMGYYDYPRKTNLNKLATLKGIEKTTFQQTLRRAEKKIIKY